MPARFLVPPHTRCVTVPRHVRGFFLETEKCKSSKRSKPLGCKGDFLMRIDFDFQPYEKPTWTYPGCDEEYTINGASISVDGGKHGPMSMTSSWTSARLKHSNRFAGA